MPHKKNAYLVVFFCTVIIVFIKYYIRPYVHLNNVNQFLVNVLPNFIGAFLFPFALIICFTVLNYFRKIKIYPASHCKTLCIGSFAILIVNEYLQLIPFFRRTFDYYDIVFSVLGLCLAYLCMQKVRVFKVAP
jgi:hypothetical protein